MRFLRTLSCLILVGASSLAAAQDQPVFEPVEPAGGDAPTAEVVPEPPPQQVHAAPLAPAQAQQAPPPNVGYPPPTAFQAPPEPERAQNTVYGELLGGGLWYSINYERLVIPDLAARIGFSYLSISASAGSASSSVSMINVPISLSYLGLGSAHHMLELGVGATLAFVTAESSSGFATAAGSGVGIIGSAFAGYRIHPVDGAGFNFRVGAMALIARGFKIGSSDPTAVGVLPFAYMSFGASF